jgi:hypothetical protein
MLRRFASAWFLVWLAVLPACKRAELVPPNETPLISIISPDASLVQISNAAHLQIFVDAANGTQRVTVGDTVALFNAPYWTATVSLSEGVNPVLITATDGKNQTTSQAFYLVFSTYRSLPLSGHMTTPRSDHTATLLPDGTVLITGGLATASGQALNTAEIYNPKTNTFTPLAAPMTTPRASHTATLLPDGTVLLYGGFTAHSADTPNLASPLAERYDPATQTFSVVPFASSSSSSYYPRYEHAACLYDSTTFFISGGATSSDNILFDVRYFSINSGFSLEGAVPLLTNTYAHTMTKVIDGLFVIIGYAFTPDGSSYTLCITLPDGNPISAAMRIPRYNHAATLVSDGLIFICGGSQLSASGTEQVLSATEFYASTPSSFYKSALTLQTPRTSHTLTQLPDGRLLVLGGRTLIAGGSFTVFNSGEIFAR